MARGDIPIIPTLNRFAGVGGFAQNFVAGIIQQQQNQAFSQQLGQVLGQPGQFQGITDPRALQLAGQLALQQPQPGFTLGPGQERFGAGGQPIAQVGAAPVSPTQQIAQRRFDFLNQLQEKDRAGTINPAETAALQKILTGAGQTINIGPSQIVTNSLALGRSFRTDERIKDMRTIEKFTQNMVTSLRRAERQKVNLGPVDIALAKSFQKLTDLGSTVREGEFATTFEGQRLINKIRGKVDAVIKGGLGFTPEDRKELVDLALALQEDSKKLFNQAITEFTVTSDELGLKTRAILGGIKPFDMTRQQGQAPAGQQPAGQQSQQQFQVGQTVFNNGVEMRITGFDSDGTPLGEPVR